MAESPVIQLHKDKNLPSMIETPARKQKFPGVHTAVLNLVLGDILR